MDVLTTVVQVLGNAVNGVLQVIADFLNLLITVLPNPDPFPEIIESLDTDTLADMGFASYWLDKFCPLEVAQWIVAGWLACLVASGLFAVVYWVVKAIKP